MSRRNVYVLRNLGTASKLAISFGLVLGFGLFFSGWVVSVTAINWDLSWMGLVNLGTRVDMLQSRWRWLLFATHGGSLALLMALSLTLVKRMPLPRLTRRALFAVATALAVTDLAAWLLLPVLGFARSILGVVVLLLTPMLAYLAGAPLRAMWQTRRWREPERPVRVVFVGGGFAGLDAATGLDRALGWSDQLEITVVDRKNYFLFPPLLPSVSVGAIETRQVTYPFRRIFEATNIRFKKETVERIDLDAGKLVSQVDIEADQDGSTLRVRHDETPFDYLVLDGRPLPPLGQVAFQQGAQTARNLARLLRGEPTRPFEYFDFGQLVSVGHQFAAVRLLGVRLSGFVAWFVWRTLYLSKLVGFGNKVRVLLDWSLDLFVERSSSQIHARREGLEAHAHHQHDDSNPPDRASASRPRAAEVEGSVVAAR